MNSAWAVREGGASVGKVRVRIRGGTELERAVVGTCTALEIEHSTLYDDPSRRSKERQGWLDCEGASVRDTRSREQKRESGVAVAFVSSKFKKIVQNKCSSPGHVSPRYLK